MSATTFMSNFAQRCLQQFDDVSLSKKIKKNRCKTSLSPLWEIISQWINHFILTVDRKEVVLLMCVALSSAIFEKTGVMIIVTVLLTGSSSIDAVPNTRYVRVLIVWGVMNVAANVFYVFIRCVTMFCACAILIPTTRRLMGKQTLIIPKPDKRKTNVIDQSRLLQDVRIVGKTTEAIYV